MPLILASPVAGFTWKASPRANEPGKEPVKNSARKRRWAKPDSPSARASVSLIAQPMSS